MHVGTTWKGEPALAELDTARLVSGDARREHDHSASWGAHQAAMEVWRGELERVRVAAYRAADAEALRRGVGAGGAATEGHEAAAQAVAEYEASSPRPTFGDAPTRVRRTARKIKERVTR